MTVNHTFTNREVLIELTGELGHHEAIAAMARIKEIIEVHAPVRLTLSLAGVSFMDSSGIAVIMQCYKACSAIGAQFAVRGASRQALRVLTTAGITKIVKFER